MNNLFDMSVNDRKALPYDSPELDNYAAETERKYGLPSGLLIATKNNGERSNSNQVSPVGAQGVMQIMPANYKTLGITDPQDPLQSIDAAGKHYAGLMTRMGTSDPHTLASAYVAGEGNVAKGKLGPVSKNYAKNVAGAQSQFVPDEEAPDYHIDISGVAGGEVPDDEAPNSAPAAITPAKPPAPIKANPALNYGGNTLQFGPLDTGIHLSNGVNNFLAGVGKSGADTAAGLGQRYDSMFGSDADVKAGQASADETDRLDKPLMTTTAGSLGNTAGQVGQMAVIPGGGLGLLGKTMLSSGAFEAAQPTVNGSSVAGNVLRGEAGGLAGLGILKGVQGAGKLGIDKLGPEARAMVQQALDWKIPLSADQMTNNPVTKAVGAVLNNLPGSGYAANTAAQASALMKKFTGAMGETGDNLATALGKAKTNISGTYNDIFGRNSVEIAPSVVADMRGVANGHLANDMSNGSETSLLHNKIDDILSKVDEYGQIPGSVYQKIRSNLGALAEKAGANLASNVSKPLKDLKAVMDGAAKNSLQAPDVPLLNQANSQYAAMKTLQKAMPKDVTAPPNITQVSNSVANNLRNDYTYGTGSSNLPDMAKVGNSVLRDADLAKSGKQLAAKTALGAAEVGAGALMGSHGPHGDGDSKFIGPIVGGLGALALGRGAGAAFTSNTMRNFMSKGTIAGIPVTKALGALGQTGQDLGAQFLGTSGADGLSR